ncbi:PREDICTED: uncharacterized protein LOC108569698 [Nicrophorus vespilloides]|uniref:Uncharacterized protein LOC108569698 n=1 Tax=Nicrophorus vespilloides TaxID=110193 RepID=A0ABM1NJ46_NICVS|nr:PREDICTED: uncharacterized protein LOC108569698 [Nicrophorus vespilloides]
MVTPSRRIRELELCNPAVFGDLVLTQQTRNNSMDNEDETEVTKWTRFRSISENECSNYHREQQDPEKRRASALLDQLLLDIHSNYQSGTTDYTSATSSKSMPKNTKYDVQELKSKGLDELRSVVDALDERVVRLGGSLVRQLKRRDALCRQRDYRFDVIGMALRKRLPEFSSEMRFSIDPLPGDSGFSQWHSAMKMVSQLPEGIPLEFRRRLWLSLADKHLSLKGIDWPRVEKNCFSEWSHPSDAELGVQIVKDLHRTGCSLFCGKDGQENQALLKRVLLAYARWNKAVGYCQGFNMLAALILQVTEKCESDALKLMIYLIEGVLPDSYFADSLRGLSVDMAVFRELLRTKLPRLSRHLDTLQVAAKEGTTSYEPPLTNVFTMQWFLTLFCNCLPQPTVLRVWDLILLEGNEVLLRTALAIWQVLAERILVVKSADEFYCVMGVLMRELLEYDLIDANTLIKGIVAFGPLTELSNLREHYLYNINPWGSSLPAADPDRRMKVYHKDRLVLDIGVLKKQYTKLKQRQRQAHIIFNTAVARQTTRTAPVAMNHLLLGKSALIPAKRLGPPKGAVPPVRQPPKTLHWKDTRRESSSSSSSDTELCDDPDDNSDGEAAQLPHDNPTPSDNNITDKSETIKDDTPEELNLSASVEPENLLDLEAPLSEPLETSNQDSANNIFDTETPSDLYALERSNSLPSEDGFDFEKFLEERVQSFKEKTFSSDESMEDTSELDRVNYARRHSQRALEIIQENSLILHRILQCQTRLTPTPPPTETSPKDESTPTNETNPIAEVSPLNIIDDESSSFISECTPENPCDDITQVDYNLDKYRSKLGSPVKELIEIDKNSKYSSILEYSRDLDEKFNNLILKSNVIKAYSFDETKDGECSKTSSEGSDECKEEGSSSSAKSPSRAYNPFPVNISSRQNKEVPLRLGLYKK